MKNKLCCFIIPYFGKLPNYFQLFLNSCRLNPDYNWLIFTDDGSPYVYPDNVERILITFEEIQLLFASKFDFEISLQHPYKFCDFKPAYGYVFTDYLKDYKYWGHCDVDTIMGCLANYIPETFLINYDKIFCLGHMTIYRNDDDINSLFMTKYRGREIYKLAFQTSKICVFDEEFQDGNNINRIFSSLGKKIYMQDLSLNFSTRYRDFRKITFSGINPKTDAALYVEEAKCKSLTIWDDGHIFRYVYNATGTIKNEYPYVHLQQRKMLFDKCVVGAKKYKIIPNRFSLLVVNNITSSTIKRVSLKSYDIGYFRYIAKRFKDAFIRRLLVFCKKENYEIDNNHTRL